MNAKFILVSLIAVLSIAMLGAFASAATNSLDLAGEYLQIDGLAYTGVNAVVAGDTVPVTLDFRALENASNVQVSAWIQGYRSDRVEKDFADLISGNDYRDRFSLVVPSDIEPEEELTLYVRVESDSGNWENAYTLKAQREANNLDVLLVDMDSTAKAGSTMAIGVVVKNMGRHLSEDTLVTVKIPEMGISKTAYFADLYPLDDCSSDSCDRENSAQGRLYLTLPSDAKSGTYKVEISALNADTETTVVKNLVISETATEGQALANPSSKTFSAGEEVAYELVLVNSGSKIAIYNLVPEASDSLSVSLSDVVATVPAGSSKVVKVYVKADKEGTYGFAVNAISSDGKTTKTNYSATVKGQSVTNNNIVVLTIVLAIVFVVLVTILIVLLTRRPQKTEEFGESYY
ncbi:MAG: hypothetical protein WC781_00215 [Candidatus Pacearchaeota archaeon]